MKKPKQPRTLEQIQAEYAQACARLGELHWKRHAMQREIEDDLHPRLKALNAEAAKITPTKEP